jgi:hypothetical protein
MCKPTAPRVDDAPGEPERQAGEVQTAIRIQGRWFYRGITTDVPTLQRLLKDAVRASDRLIARLQKARRQRDAARDEAHRASEHCYRAYAVALPAAVDAANDAWKPTIAALIAPKTRALPGDPAHCVEYALSPQMVALDHGDTLVATTVDRLLKKFQAEGYTPRTIVIRVQDW